MIKRIFKLLVLGSALCMPASAIAAKWCEGKIVAFYTDSGGNFFILSTFRNEWLQICSVNQAWKGISTQTCGIWVSSIITGTASDRNFTVLYYEDTACSAIPAYSSAPAPGYVMMHK